MSLAILVPLVIVGVSLVIATIHLSGLSKRARIEDDAAARTRYAFDYPLDDVALVDLTSDGRAAFLTLADGAIGIVQCFGDRYVTERLVADGSVRVDVRDGALAIAGPDMTWAGGIYRFGDAETAKRLAARISGEPARNRQKEHA